LALEFGVLSSKKLLITGATGAIGLGVLRQLKTLGRLKGVRVFARDSRKNNKKLRPFFDSIEVVHGDITDLESVKKACREQDIIIHLAAVIPPFSEQHPELGHRINHGGTVNVIRAMEAVNPEAFLLFSSSIAVYGDRLKNPVIKVSDPLAVDQHDHYGKAKIGAEKAIRESKINWCIFRLTAIMGIGNQKVSGIMFDVPLETPMEICTVRDTARALVSAINKQDQLNNKIFNLSGGEECRIPYSVFLARAFKAFGLGKVNFPDYAFARQNFHCGHYADGDELERILQFREDNIDSYFDRFDASVLTIQKMVTIPVAGIAKWFLLGLSRPHRAYRRKDKARMNFYFGEQ
jgi:nucleoside-diphosphate-sugar epimerase